MIPSAGRGDPVCFQVITALLYLPISLFPCMSPLAPAMATGRGQPPPASDLVVGGE